MRKIHIIAAACALFAAGSAAAEHFKVIAPLGEDADGAMARLVNFDTGAAIDSVLVSDGAATFEGEIDESVLGRVMVDGMRQPVFILESGTISFGHDGAFGTMLNDQLREMGGKLSALAPLYRAAETEEAAQAVMDQYNAVLDSVLNANTDNALGYYVFLNGSASSMDAPQLREAMQKYPSFAKYERIKKLIATAEKREATQPGSKFIDFEVTYNGETKRLSDYVGKGKYTLVDFWASWCGPCMRQLPVLKDIYNEYHDKGLDVLGVAVWDEPEATKKAIADHGLVWDTIIDAQTIPTDIYGIQGIPCIMLFGPDGTILSRDKQGDELKADVKLFMEAANK